MSINEILKEIELLPPKDRILLTQKALKSIQSTTSKNELQIAAEEMIDEYRTDKDLTVFTDIDFEKFYEAK